MGTFYDAYSGRITLRWHQTCIGFDEILMLQTRCRIHTADQLTPLSISETVQLGGAIDANLRLLPLPRNKTCSGRLMPASFPSYPTSKDYSSQLSSMSPQLWVYFVLCRCPTLTFES